MGRGPAAIRPFPMATRSAEPSPEEPLGYFMIFHCQGFAVVYLRRRPKGTGPWLVNSISIGDIHLETTTTRHTKESNRIDNK